MCMAFRGFATGHRAHVGGLFACQCWPGAWSGMLIPRTHACLDKACASTLNRCNPTGESGSQVVIRKSVGRVKQDSRPGALATAMFTTSQTWESLLSLIRGSIDDGCFRGHVGHPPFKSDSRTVPDLTQSIKSSVSDY
jgi:hypothetical protein